ARTAFARIGETKGELRDRYGVGSPLDVFISYRFHRFNIGVQFDDDGRSGIEIYAKIDKSPITEGEVQALMDANSDGTPWVKAEEIGSRKLYRSAHREAVLLGREVVIS